MFQSLTEITAKRKNTEIFSFSGFHIPERPNRKKGKTPLGVFRFAGRRCGGGLFGGIS